MVDPVLSPFKFNTFNSVDSYPKPNSLHNKVVLEILFLYIIKNINIYSVIFLISLIKHKILSIFLIISPHTGGVFATLMPKEEYFSKALYTFDIGQNDLTAGFFSNKSIEQVIATVPDIVNSFLTSIKVP